MLISGGNPLAIARFIVTVYVYPFNRHTIRTWADISIEVFKTIQPPFANLDTPTAVVFPV